MRLSTLAGEDARILGPRDAEVCGLAADSRRLRPGELFAALAGSRTDGTAFVEDAIERGAAALLGDSRLERWAGRLPVVVDANPRRRFARMAARFYALQPAFVAAVTGTNGKSSVVSFLRQIWRGCGLSAASLGTLGIEPVDAGPCCPLTTPDPITLHAACRALAEKGITHLALEASSHGLDQYRLDGLVLSAAAFTNLSRDHFDYHRDEEAYLAAKARLFSELVPPGAPAVLNADVDAFERLASIAGRRGLRILDYGHRASALRLLGVRPHAGGITFRFLLDGRERHCDVPLFGTFQVHNLLASVGLAVASGLGSDGIVAGLSGLQGVRGRMERVAGKPGGGTAFVDYAHTPDALSHALRALRAHFPGRLIVVFGCGGDRDPGKRPQMGAIAERFSDLAIVTDDNPRSEDPGVIRRQILEVMGPHAVEIGARAEAIRHGWDLLGPDDVLLVAGKGHETGQIVGDRVLPFSDHEVLQRLARGERT